MSTLTAHAGERRTMGSWHRGEEVIRFSESPIPRLADSLRLRSARRDDLDAWIAMRSALWPDVRPEDLRSEVEEWLWSGDRDVHCIVAESRGELLGLIELSVRSRAEGCDGHRVGYVEGWYVAPAARGHHLGRDLMYAGEAWARARGCVELASGAALGDAEGQGALVASGFLEAGRVVCYRKVLGKRLTTYEKRVVEHIEPREHTVDDGPQDGVVDAPGDHHGQRTAHGDTGAGGAALFDERDA